MLTGLLGRPAGHARSSGHDVQREPEAAKRLLAYVPDFPFLYEKLTCGEFMRFIGEMFQVPGGRFTGRTPSSSGSRWSRSGTSSRRT